MKYIFVALCSLLLAVAWSEDTAPHPAVTGITSTYQGGRVVQVRWNNPAISAQQRVACEIYRDGELVYRGILRENDEETDGEVWSGTTTQTFKDTLAHPGSTHEYTVVYRTEDGVESLPALTSVALALPAFSGLTISYAGGRNVTLSFLLGVNYFPDLKYRVYRDGEKIGEMPFRGSGTLENGNTWDGTGSRQYFTDTQATPGESHEYRLVMDLYPGCPLVEGVLVLEIPLPAVRNLTVEYRGGRTVQIALYRTINTFPDLVYEIYRDGILVGSMPHDTAGTAENGDYWTNGGLWQYFNDTHATPGATHEYRLVANLYPGCPLVEEIRTLAIALPAFSSLVGDYRGGRTVQIAFYRTMNTFPDLIYEIYRDGVLVGAMPHDTAGTAENGDYWSNGGFWQYYNDTHATPGENHEYRVVANLYSGGPVVEQFLEVPIPLPEFSSLSYVYRGGRSVQFQFLKTMNTFPDLVYEIYRDGAFVGSMPHDTSGTAENGDTWSNGGSWQYYTDTHATPGENHEYRLVANLYSGGPLVEEFLDMPIPLPEFSSLSCVYLGGRSVRIQFYKSMTTFPDLIYEIYRDGAFVGSIPHDTSGTAENGDSWSNGGFWQYYTDTHAIPGQTNIYRVIARLYEDGPTVVAAYDLYIPLPQFYDGNCLEKHGDTIRVCIYMNMSAFPDLVYAIYRDGEFIGEFLAGSEGENVLGNSWYAGPYWQYFVDSSPIPVTKHQYRIVATLYEGGPVLDEEFSILTSKPAFSLETNAYLPVIQRLASGEYLLAACINSQPFGPLAEMDIEVSGAGAVFTDSGLTTMRVPNAAFTTDGLVTMYIVAAADIDPDSASIQLRYQCVEID